MATDDEQHEWCNAYIQATGFEPIIRSTEKANGEISFEEFALANIQWFRNWAEESAQMIERAMPETEDA